MNSITHITRRNDLLDHASHQDISLQEWTSFLYNDPEMRLDNFTTVTLANGELYSYPNPGAAVFLYRQSGSMETTEISFEYVDGSIVIKNADRKVLEKIRHVAFKLNARIFKETKATTFEIPSLTDAITPLFDFSTMLNPIKKPVLQLVHFIQHLHWPFSRLGNKNSPVNASTPPQTWPPVAEASSQAIR